MAYPFYKTNESSYFSECTVMQRELSPSPYPNRQAGIVSQEVLAMEQELFGEANQAYKVLNDSGLSQIDGQTYQQIHSDPQMSERLDQIRQNVPSYQYMTTRQKSNHLTKLAQQFQTSLSLADSNPSTKVMSRKRVRFNKQSKCKYFDKQQPSSRVGRKRIHKVVTFC